MSEVEPGHGHDETLCREDRVPGESEDETLEDLVRNGAPSLPEQSSQVVT